MKPFSVALAAASALAMIAAPAVAQKKIRTTKGTVTLYELPNFNGESYEVTKGRPSLSLDWPVRSISVHAGDAWQLCEKKTYKGSCADVNASVPDTAAAGTIQVVQSARPATRSEAAPAR